MDCILYSVDNFLTVGRRFYFGECFYLLKATWSRHMVSVCMICTVMMFLFIGTGGQQCECLINHQFCEVLVCHVACLTALSCRHVSRYVYVAPIVRPEECSYI